TRLTFSTSLSVNAGKSPAPIAYSFHCEFFGFSNWLLADHSSYVVPPSPEYHSEISFGPGSAHFMPKHRSVKYVTAAPDNVLTRELAPVIVNARPASNGSDFRPLMKP